MTLEFEGSKAAAFRVYLVSLAILAFVQLSPAFEVR